MWGKEVSALWCANIVVMISTSQGRIKELVVWGAPGELRPPHPDNLTNLQSMVGFKTLSLATKCLLPLAEGPPWKCILSCSRRNLRELQGPACSGQTQAGPQWLTGQALALHSRLCWPCWVEMSFEKPVLGLLKDAIDLIADYFHEMAHWTGFPFSPLKGVGDKHSPRIIISKSFTLPLAKTVTTALKYPTAEDSRKN